MNLLTLLTLPILILGLLLIKINPCDSDAKIFERLSLKDNAVVCFKTIDSFDLNYENKPELTIYGNLKFPEKKQNKYNAVILSHGSGGIRKYHNNYIEILNESGYIVFQIDHYLGRNMKYDGNFSKISGITLMNDVYKALALLKTHPQIEKIGYIGWSQGGVGPIMSHFQHINNYVNNSEYTFDASVAIYPYCGFTFPENSITTTPLLMITGGKDDLTPEKACINLFNKFKNGTGEINHMSFEGARHGYDNPFLLLGYTFDRLPSLHIINNDCTLTISESRNIITLNNRIISGPKDSAEVLSQCSTKGVHVKYNEKAARQTKLEIIKFFNSKF